MTDLKTDLTQGPFFWLKWCCCSVPCLLLLIPFLQFCSLSLLAMSSGSILWLGSSPPASSPSRGSMECPLASSQSLCHVRIKSGLEVVNHSQHFQPCLLGFWGISHSFTSGFVITDSMYLLLPCSLNPERRKADWCWSQHSCSLPPFLFFPPFLFSRTRYVASINFTSSLFPFLIV